MRGNGRVFQRKNSPFWWTAYYHRGAEQREIARHIRTGEKLPATEKHRHEAERFLKHRLGEIAGEEHGGRLFIGPEQSRVLINELLDDLVAEYRRGGKQGIAREPSAQYLSTVKQVRAYFGAMRAAAVRKSHIDAYIQLRQEQGKRNATINRALELLGAAFKLAVASDQPKLARALKIRELDESDNVRKGKFSKAEMEQVTASLPAYMVDVARFAYETGARSGEILKLRWSYLDGDAICVPASDTKSRKPRSITFTPELEAIIARRQAARTPECELIFHHDGRAIKDYRKGWNAACVVNGLGRFYCRTCRDAQKQYISVLDAERRCPRCGAKPDNPKYIGKLMHDFRRSAAYELWRGGSTVEECMEVTGHATENMFKRYADLFTEEEKRVRQRETQERRRKWRDGQQEQELLAMPATRQ